MCRHSDDPRRNGERDLCLTWQRAIRDAQPNLVVRRNYPYRGSDDGFTTCLRKRFGERSYAGIELELSQKFTRRRSAQWGSVRTALIDTFAAALADLG